MKWSLFLIALMAACVALAQAPAPQSSPQSKQSPSPQGLSGLLIERARLLFGPGSTETLSFTNRVSVPQTAERRSRQSKQTEESPFTSPDYEESTKAMSLKGDVASGVILEERKDVLYLDLTPCQAEITVFTFHAPFAKKHLGTLNCKGKRIDKFLVAQR